MKRFNFIITVVAILLCSIIFCSYSKNNNKTVRGFVHVYGNEPFTYIGIETDDNKQYALSADDEEISKLWQSQGNKIEITGIITSKKGQGPERGMLQDGKIQVIEWKYIK